MFNTGILGSLITLGIFTAGAIFKLGQHSARLEELERWRNSIRVDMHEISDKLEDLSKQMTALMTLIDERTERREIKRA